MPHTVQIGSQGEDVRRLQEALVAQGYYVGNVDGVFGTKTAAAVAYFESVCGLEIDGVAGPHVYDYLGVADQNDSVHIQLPQADIAIPNEVVQATGEYHVLVHAFDGANSIGEQAGSVHVHHEGHEAPQH